jgi:tripartite ATP-independent transporter DctM subunit
MEPWLMTVIVFGVLLVGIALALPIAFVLAGIGVVFTYILWGPSGVVMVTTTLRGSGMDFILLAVPLFILMANFLEASDLASDLYDAMYIWIGGLPGGLASGTVVICAIFAAMAGISGVATVTMGLIAVPSMLRLGYDKKLAVGTVAAGGALGILIPPSIPLVIYGSITETSVGALFMGAMIPGILLAILFIIYVTVRSIFQPSLAPAVKMKSTLREKLKALKSVIYPFSLIIIVLGTIYSGICTPTEAAAVGALGAMVCAALRKKLTLKVINTALWKTFTMTVMVIWIVFGASCFSSVYTLGGASEFMISLVQGWNISPIAMVWLMMVIWLMLGCLLDPMGMLLITIPVFVPIIKSLGLDPVWFGVLFVINCEMAYITPPFGFNLFYMKAIVPKSVTMGDIYRSIIPFVFVQFFLLALCIYFPKLVLWLPSVMVK